MPSTNNPKLSNKDSGYDVRKRVSNSASHQQKTKGFGALGNSDFLDLFSTSQTFEGVPTENVANCASAICIKNAPYFAFQKHDTSYGVIQGCCNSWNCPRCGIMRAKHEYGRIVQGCKTLSEKYGLWFITITCRGKEMSKQSAEQNYGKWTNTLLTRWRTYSTRKGQEWYYAQVTERQKRGHPHSHILTTFDPCDTVSGTKRKWEMDNAGKRHYVEKEALFSDYVRRSCVAVGLGDQYDISRVASAEAASRYVAKYLFKDTIFTENWPKGWRRVRYSQSFPKLEREKSNAFVLMTREDWWKLASLASVITSDCDQTYDLVKNALGYTNILIR